MGRLDEKRNVALLKGWVMLEIVVLLALVSGGIFNVISMFVFYDYCLSDAISLKLLIQ